MAYAFRFRWVLFLSLVFCLQSKAAELPDSVYLFAYSTDEGRSGLNLAWSADQHNWHAIGPGHTFLFSDFGRWGTQKRLFSPYLLPDENGWWHCVWSLNDTTGQFAHAASKNLYDWKRQAYPIVMAQGGVREPEIFRKGDQFYITWQSDSGIFQTTTADFKDFAPTHTASTADRLNLRRTASIDGQSQHGMVYRVSWDLVDGLIKREQWTRFHNSERAELMKDDPTRFAGLKPVAAQIQLKPAESKPISNMLMGIFFEDISYAADGGLYAELVQNRDFEYNLADKDYTDTSWTAKKAWSTKGETLFAIDSLQPIHINNKHYASLNIQGKNTALVNSGWDGIPVEEGKQYHFSVFARISGRSKGSIRVQLTGSSGQILATTVVNLSGNGWKQYEASLSVNATDADAHLEIWPQINGRLDLDMISLFPQHTFKNRKNGLRADLAQTIADMKPRFVRFPGGCVAHGDGIANMYRWENTIGPLEARVPQKNIWRYHQTAGMGYFEYFQFCEDIGAQPVPVVPAGVPCQNSGTGGHGQQCGIPMDAMDEYLQSILNLIEWANGDVNTEWGKKRAAAGHPKPFNLKYLGVGNEDLITDIFEERFTMIYQAIREKHPEITVIGTVGPFYMGTDYDEGWALAKKLDIPIVDEHYYQPPGWFINNQDFYDKYDRKGPKVYLGEYASFVPGRRMNIETALSEALYLTAVERNGDVVQMASFAPLLAKENFTRWNPDLIYFDNTTVKPTVDYYVQQLYGQHAGNRYIPAEVRLSDNKEPIRERIGISTVQDETSGDLIIKLVNLLPVPVETALDLGAFQPAKAAKLWILQGSPNDEQAKPSEKEIQAGRKMEYQLPAYSFAVIRMKKG